MGYVFSLQRTAGVLCLGAGGLAKQVGSLQAPLFNLNTLPFRCREEKTDTGKKPERFLCLSPREEGEARL